MEFTEAELNVSNFSNRFPNYALARQWYWCWDGYPYVKIWDGPEA